VELAPDIVTLDAGTATLFANRNDRGPAEGVLVETALRSGMFVVGVGCWHPSDRVEPALTLGVDGLTGYLFGRLSPRLLVTVD
jgi:hypothetical protein